MYDVLAKGGPLIVPIAVAAIVALAILMERIWTLRRERIIPRRFVDRIKELAEEDKISEAVVLCEQDESYISVILLAGIRHANKPRVRVKEAMEEAGKTVTSELERYVNALGTIAAISPLMGLLGTVTGMIEVFQKVTTEGVGDPRVLATGIWEALVTTAAGLTVAIPTYIVYRYLMGRVDRLVTEMEEASLEVADAITEK